MQPALRPTPCPTQVYEFLGESVVWIVITVGGCLMLRSLSIRLYQEGASACMHASTHVCMQRGAACPCMHACTPIQTCACTRAVVAFSPTVGAALHNALVGVVGSILGAALGILIIALVAVLATSFSYQDHPVEMVGPRLSARP